MALKEEVLFLLLFLLSDGWNKGINNAATTLTHQKKLEKKASGLGHTGKRRLDSDTSQGNMSPGLTLSDLPDLEGKVASILLQFFVDLVTSK